MVFKVNAKSKCILSEVFSPYFSLDFTLKNENISTNFFKELNFYLAKFSMGDNDIDLNNCYFRCSISGIFTTNMINYSEKFLETHN